MVIIWDICWGLEFIKPDFDSPGAHLDRPDGPVLIFYTQSVKAEL